MTLLAPGSAPWLLHHEVRLTVRSLLARPGGGASRRWRLALVAVAIVGPATWVGWMLAGWLARHPPAPSPLVCIGLEVGMAYLLTLMTAQALTFATYAFYERNDLDLLLSSPLPPGRVLVVRGLGIAASSAAIYLVLASALILPLLVRGRPAALSLYVVIGDLALIATALGLALAMALFRVLGARRTRVVSQVLAALIGASAFLLVQARNLLPRGEWNALVARLGRFRGEGYDPHALYAWPARAVLGDPWALLALTIAAALVFRLTAQAVGRRFAGDAAAAAGVGHTGAAQGRRRAAGADRMRFSGSPGAALARKDVRLLVRDPWLISQLAMQLLYMLPLVFLIWRNAGPHLAAAASAPVIFFAAQLAGNLTWVVVSAEDAPELIAAAPVSGAQVVRAKLAVSLAPVAALAFVPLLVLAAASPLAGLSTTLCLAAASLTAALMNVWYAKPADRRRMMRRRSQSGLMGVAETLLILAWSATGYLLLTEPTRLYGVGLAAVALAALWLLRRPTVYAPAPA